MDKPKLPSDTLPGKHLRFVDPEIWVKHCDFSNDEPNPGSPNLEWCLSPLGGAIEVGWCTATHRLCVSTEPLRRDLIPFGHPGIVAEALYARGMLAEFEALVHADPAAGDHILSIPTSFDDEGLLAEAQHHIRAVRARVAATNALQEIASLPRR